MATYDLENNRIFRLFRHAGAVVADDHIVYTSGRHGSAYVNKDAVYPHPDWRKELACDLAHPFIPAGVGVVVGPAIGGAILAMYVGDRLDDPKKRVVSAYAEKQTDGTFVIKRGFDALIRGMVVLVVEDILTTGASARGVVEAVRACGGTVIGVSAICNRGKVTPAMLGDVPRLVSLIDLDLESWPEEECPLCKAGKPINTKLGKGREFLARKAQPAT